MAIIDLLILEFLGLRLTTWIGIFFVLGLLYIVFNL